MSYRSVYLTQNRFWKEIERATRYKQTISDRQLFSLKKNCNTNKNENSDDLGVKEPRRHSENIYT